MLNQRIIRTFKQIIPVGIIWFGTSLVFLWSDYASTGGQTNTLDSAIVVDIEILIFASLNVFLIGILVGYLELTVINKWFRNHSFLKKIISKQLFYLLLMEFLIFILYPTAAAIELQTSIFSKVVIDKYILFFFSITHLGTIIQLGFSLLLSLLYLEIADNLGQHVLNNFFTGRYHKPKEETRIFLFSDMKSSTAIAEKLGHVQYFKLLQEYYNQLSNSIIDTKGEVYQYIGDEIVISWNVNKKNLSNEAVNCFLKMKCRLKKKRHYFENKYGVTVDFKAAIHIGEVTTGEIGALKKEIFFTGDVLNTTSRMQSLCREYQTDLIISKSILEELTNSSLTKNFIKIENVNLKGKSNTIELYKFQN